MLWLPIFPLSPLFELSLRKRLYVYMVQTPIKLNSHIVAKSFDFMYIELDHFDRFGERTPLRLS